jgi:thiamine biosynthesis lipoprotein
MSPLLVGDGEGAGQTVSAPLASLGKATGRSRRRRSDPVSRTEKVMDSFATISACGRRSGSAIEAAFERMAEIEAQVGRDLDSDLNRINLGRAGVAVAVRPDTWEILRLAKRYWSLTRGAFDVTVGPLVDLWGFGFDGCGRLPSAAEIEETMAAVGSDKLTLDPTGRSVRLETSGMTITVAGIAKGYAVEQAAATLRKHGVERALMNGGASSIKAVGRAPGMRHWRVGIEHPRFPDRLPGVLRLASGKSVGTSSDGRRSFVAAGRRYSHVIDPRTGHPAATGIIQASAISADAVETEVLAKALLLGGEWSRQLQEESGFGAILVDILGQVHVSRGVRLSR